LKTRKIKEKRRRKRRRRREKSRRKREEIREERKRKAHNSLRSIRRTMEMKVLHHPSKNFIVLFGHAVAP
jgi:hypothetical protein